MRIGIVRRRVGINLPFFPGVDRPRGNVNLLAQRHRQALEERVHVLPAVQLADTANLGVGYGDEGVAGTIPVYEFLYMGGLDLSAMIDDVAIGIDQGLGEIQRGVVNLGESQGNIDLIVSAARRMRRICYESTGASSRGMPSAWVDSGGSRLSTSNKDTRESLNHATC